MCSFCLDFRNIYRIRERELKGWFKRNRTQKVQKRSYSVLNAWPTLIKKDKKKHFNEESVEAIRMGLCSLYGCRSIRFFSERFQYWQCSLKGEIRGECHVKLIQNNKICRNEICVACVFSSFRFSFSASAIVCLYCMIYMLLVFFIRLKYVHSFICVYFMPLCHISHFGIRFCLPSRQTASIRIIISVFCIWKI